MQLCGLKPLWLRWSDCYLKLTDQTHTLLSLKETLPVLRLRITLHYHNAHDLPLYVWDSSWQIDGWSKNNVIKTTDPLQRIGSRKQENLFACGKWMCIIEREEFLTYHTSCLKFHIEEEGGSTAIPIEKAIHAEKGAEKCSHLGRSPDPPLHDGII